MIERHLKKITTLVFIVAYVLAKVLIGPITCNSGWSSPSIGLSGACSHHGGVASWKGTLPILLSAAAALFFYFHFKRQCRNAPDVSTSPPMATAFLKVDMEQQAVVSNDAETPASAGNSKKDRGCKNKSLCPRCHSAMRLRTATKGNNAGHKFWGCSKYPRCKGTRSYLPESKWRMVALLLVLSTTRGCCNVLSIKDKPRISV